MSETKTISIRMSPEEVARLDEIRPSDTPRATYLRSFFQEPPREDEVCTRSEALGILSRMARAVTL
jgi:hypothetical protein